MVAAMVKASVHEIAQEDLLLSVMRMIGTKKIW